MKNIIILFIFLTPILVKGQSFFSLDSILVSSSKIDKKINETGRDITVITQEEIAKMPVQSFDELLRYITSVNLNARAGFGVQADIGMRGSTFSQVLILVDNIRLNDPLTAHFNNNLPVPLSEIAQIEIIRGPAAASFGSEAVGGVIHIKTKTYIDYNSKPDHISSAGSVGVGEHNLLVTDFSINGQQDRWKFSAGLKTSTSDGETFSNPNFTAGISEDSLYNTFFDLKTYTGALNYQINSAWNIYARAGLDKRNFNAKYFYTRSNYDESTEEITSLWSQLALKRKSGKHETELNAGYKSTDDLFIFNPLFTPNEHTTTRTILTLNHRYNPNKKISIAAGGQVENKVIESTDRGDHENVSAGFYSILSYKIIENLNSTTSLRLEYDDNFGIELLPQISASYKYKNYIFRTSFGKSIRAADFTERYISSQIPNLSPGRNIGNPDLEAERAYTTDIGVDWRPGKKIKASVTAFFRASDNLIDYTLTNSNQIENVSTLQENEEYFYTTNISSSNTSGVEIHIEKQILINHLTTLNLAGGYTFLETKTEEGVVSKYLANHPKHNANLILDFNSKYFNLSIANNYIFRDSEFAEAISSTVIKDYFITDIKLSATPFQKKVSIFVNCKNILDTEYQEILGARMPGRWWLAGISWNIQ